MRRRLVTLLLAAVCAILLTPVGAAADEQGEETVSGQIRDPDTIEGVEISVSQDGEEIGRATTDADGEWEVPLPGPGVYDVAVDPDTVPDELEIAETPGPEHTDVDVGEGDDRGVIFRLALPGEAEDEDEPGPADSPDDEEAAEEELEEEAQDADEGAFAPEVDEGASFGERFAQVAANGLVFGLVIAIAGVGLSLIFGTTRMINFAHGDMVTFGGLMALLFSAGAGGLGNALLGIVASVAVAVALGMVLGRRLPTAAVRTLQVVVLVLGVVGSTLVGALGPESWDWQVSLAGDPGIGSAAGKWLVILLAPLVLGGLVVGTGRALRDRLDTRWVLIVQGAVLVAGLAGGLAVGVFGAVVITVVLGAALGLGMERFIWQPLRVRNVAMIQLFIVSIGVALLLRHALLVVFGAGRSSYPEYQIQELVGVGPVAIAPRQLAIMAIAVVVLVAVACMLQFSRIGRAMRAVADNRDLAESSGIDVARVTSYVWALAGALSALGGIMAGLNQVLHWQMGFHLLLLMFAAVILGGLGTAYGAMVGGIAIGLVAMLSTLWFPHQLMQAWALAIMIVMLLVRPQGLLGRRERIG